MKIGLNIKKLRVGLNMTQAELAGDVINRSVLNRIESCKADPSVSQLLYLAKKLNSNIDRLIFGTTQNELILPNNTFEDTILSSLYNSNNFQDIITFYHNNKDLVNSTKGFLTNFYIGMSYISTGKDAQSIPFFLKFCRKYEFSTLKDKSANVIEYARAKNALSQSLFFCKRIDEIEKHLIQANTQLIKFGKTYHHEYLTINQNLIRYYNLCEESENAQNIIKRVLNPKSMIIHKDTTAATHQSASVTYRDLKQFDQSHYHLDLAILLYRYAGNEEKVGLCSISKFNLWMEKGDYSTAIQFIINVRNKFSPEKQMNHVLGLQAAKAHINTMDYENAKKHLATVKYCKLTQMDRATYTFVKGILDYKDGNPTMALKKLNSCESAFLYNKFFYDLKLMNRLRYQITGEQKYLDQNSKFPFGLAKRNVLMCDSSK